MALKKLMKDKILAKLIKETAEELDIRVDTVWGVFNHFHNYVHKLMTELPMKGMNIETKRKLARNIFIPGFGRLLNVYGKTYKSKGVKENKTINYGSKED